MGVFKSKIHGRIYFYLILLLAFVIPFHNRVVAAVIALIGLNWILEFNFREKFMRLKQSRRKCYLLSFGILYLMYGLGVFYSSNLDAPYVGAYANMEEKLSLLVFPLLFSTITFDAFNNNYFRRILDFFIAGNLINGFLLLAISYSDYLQGAGDVTSFYYTHLAHGRHPSYLALYFAFSIAILIQRLIQHAGGYSKKHYFQMALILIFQVFVVLLSSKAGILSLALLYGIVFMYLLLKKRLYPLRKLFIPFLLMGSFFITLLPFPHAYGRFITVKSSIENAKEIPAETKESSAERILIWKSTWGVIEENPVFGVGTGDVKDALMEGYQANHVQGAINDKLNAHNQYLQITVALGIFGLILLLLSLTIPLYFSFRKNALLYILFLLLIGFNFLFESMLERQAGVVFYAFFNSLMFTFCLYLK